MTPGDSVTGQSDNMVVCYAGTVHKPMCNIAQHSALRAILCPRMSDHELTGGLPSQDMPRVRCVKGVRRDTDVRVQGSITRGGPIASAASLVTPSLGNLSSCAYPRRSYKRCAHARSATSRACAVTDGKLCAPKISPSQMRSSGSG